MARTHRLRFRAGRGHDCPFGSDVASATMTPTSRSVHFGLIAKFGFREGATPTARFRGIAALVLGPVRERAVLGSQLTLVQFGDPRLAVVPCMLRCLDRRKVDGGVDFARERTVLCR